MPSNEYDENVGGQKFWVVLVLNIAKFSGVARLR